MKEWKVQLKELLERQGLSPDNPEDEASQQIWCEQESFIQTLLSSQLKEVLGVINSFKLDTCETVGCGCNGDKRYNEALDDLKAEVEKLV